MSSKLIGDPGYCHKVEFGPSPHTPGDALPPLQLKLSDQLETALVTTELLVPSMRMPPFE